MVRRWTLTPNATIPGCPEVTSGSLALVLDVGEVLIRHGYPAPVGTVLVDLTAGIYRALHPAGHYFPPTVG